MIFEILSWLVAAPLSLLLTYLALEVSMGLSRLSDRGHDVASDVRLAIVIPAHNEATGIGSTVDAALGAAPAARVLVVADNCQDATAAIARERGAEVIERSDADNRGKGYALAFGRNHLAEDPPEAVLVIDADCRLAPGSAERLAGLAKGTGRAIQAENLLGGGERDSPLVAISNFAFLVKNLVRARGLMRLGGGVSLFGTGMAFPWALFQTLPLATSNAVEDLQIGLWLARQGSPVLLDDRSHVRSNAASIEDSQGQRSRWEHGFVEQALRQGVPLLAAGATRFSRNLLTLGAHMLVPPLALLMVLTLAGCVIIAALCLLAGSWSPLIAVTAAFALALIALLAAWWREGRQVLSFGTLLRAPLYIVWKLPIYLGFFTRRQAGWNRTRREGEQP